VNANGEEGEPRIHKFIIFCLNDDKRQSVDVEEVEEVNFFEVT